MPKISNLRLVFTLALAMILGLVAACAAVPENEIPIPVENEKLVPPPYPFTIINAAGGRVDWSPDGTQIAYDRLEDDGFHDVRLMDETGKDLGCLTCDHPHLPNRDIGQPAWHPSGKYLVFQAEKAVHDSVRFRNVTAPGSGVYNDLWIMDMASKDVFLLHEIPNAATAAALHPHFSADGTQLSWGELYQEGNLFRRGSEIGLWNLNVAPFIDDDAGLRLGEIHTFVPGVEGWYENHGFSPDGTKLLFSGCYEKGVPVYFANIYTYDLSTGEATRLTSEGYNEHALFSPDGEWILWMSSAGVPKHETGARGTEYWRMRPDGSGKERLTYFNTVTNAPRKDSIFVVADSAWAPAGDRFVGYMHVVSNATEIISATAGEFWNVVVELGDL